MRATALRSSRGTLVMFSLFLRIHGNSSTGKVALLNMRPREEGSLRLQVCAPSRLRPDQHWGSPITLVSFIGISCRARLLFLAPYRSPPDNTFCFGGSRQTKEGGHIHHSDMSRQEMLLYDGVGRRCGGLGICMPPSPCPGCKLTWKVGRATWPRRFLTRSAKLWPHHYICFGRL